MVENNRGIIIFFQYIINRGVGIIESGEVENKKKSDYNIFIAYYYSSDRWQ